MYNIKRSLAELCNGSTTDSDSVCWGSNPYSAAKTKPRSSDCGFVFSTGFEQGWSKAELCGKKQSGGLFLPTWATSEARRRRRQPSTIAERNQGNEIGRSNTVVRLWFRFFNGIRTRMEQSGALRKKTVRGTVFADVGNERSEAKTATAVDNRRKESRK